MALDPVGLVNFLLNLAIIVAGYMGYRKTNGKIFLFMALAFVVFSITNLLAALEMSAQFLYPIIVMRIAGYLIILYALYRGMSGK